MGDVRMTQKPLIRLALLLLLSGCTDKEWVEGYVGGKIGEIKPQIQVVDKETAENKARLASLEEETRLALGANKAQMASLQEGINLTLKDCKSQIEALRHDINHIDTNLHALSLEHKKAIENLKKEVHADATAQESKVAGLMEKVQKLDAEVVKFRKDLQSMDDKVKELEDVLYPLIGKEIKGKTTP
jgi:chromosome segregation ATPase